MLLVILSALFLQDPLIVKETHAEKPLFQATIQRDGEPNTLAVARLQRIAAQAMAELATKTIQINELSRQREQVTKIMDGVQEELLRRLRAEKGYRNGCQYNDVQEMECPKPEEKKKP